MIENKKPEQTKLPQGLEAFFVLCETWQARVVGALLLALFNLFTTTKLAAFILGAIWFLIVWGLKAVNTRPRKFFFLSVLLAIILTLSWPFIRHEIANNLAGGTEQPLTSKPRLQSDYSNDFQISKSRISTPVGAVIESSFASRDAIQPIGIKMEGEKTIVTYSPLRDEIDKNDKGLVLPEETRYHNSQTLNVGEAFYDELTGASLGVSDIGALNTGKVRLSLPTEQTQVLSDIGAGSSWKFEINGKKYRITITAVKYIGSSFQVTLNEIEN